MNDSRFDNMPLILETPEESLWEKEIALLYSFAGTGATE
jgi:deoxyribonuclease-4